VSGRARAKHNQRSRTNMISVLNGHPFIESIAPNCISHFFLPFFTLFTLFTLSSSQPWHGKLNQTEERSLKKTGRGKITQGRLFADAQDFIRLTHRRVGSHFARPSFCPQWGRTPPRWCSIYDELIGLCGSFEVLLDRLVLVLSRCGRVIRYD